MPYVYSLKTGTWNSIQTNVKYSQYHIRTSTAAVDPQHNFLEILVYQPTFVLKFRHVSQLRTEIQFYKAAETESFLKFKAFFLNTGLIE